MRILQVVHGFPPAAHGGTEIYTRDLAAALAGSGDEVAVLTRHADAHGRELALCRSTLGAVQVFSINNTFNSCESFEASYANPLIEHIAGQVLDEWAMHTSTSGGSSDTDVNELAAMPDGPSAPWPVTTVTPVAKCPRIVRNSALSTESSAGSESRPEGSMRPAGYRPSRQSAGLR